MQALPYWLNFGFIAITILSIFLFYLATGKNKLVLLILCAWALLHGALSFSGFYTDTTAIPPRFTLMVIPPLALTLLLFLTKKGRTFIDNLDPRMLTLFHTIRVGVEMVIYGLFLHKLMPELMTFEGRNMDILSGLTAPLVYYLVFVKKWAGKRLLFYWNLLALGILLFTVTNGVMSAPGIFQQQAFDQPNTAVLYFPFAWLAAIVVPLSYFSHLAAIRQIVRKKNVKERRQDGAGIKPSTVLLSKGPSAASERTIH